MGEPATFSLTWAQVAAIGGSVSLFVIGFVAKLILARIKFLEDRDREQVAINEKINVSLAEVNLQMARIASDIESEKGTRQRINQRLEFKLDEIGHRFDSVVQAIHRIEMRGQRHRKDDDDTIDERR